MTSAEYGAAVVTFIQRGMIFVIFSGSDCWLGCVVCFATNEGEWTDVVLDFHAIFSG